MKRLTDIVGALIALLLTSPIIVAAMCAILIDTGLPVLFRQERVGRDGVPFVLWKLRTMTPGGDESRQREFNRRELAGELSGQDVYTLEADDRITSVGRLLRRYSIDELPQLFNVLKGDISLVGPRPSMQYEVEIFPRRFARRLEVRPGLTGLWQTSGRRTVDMTGMLELDVEYVQRRSFWLDLRILLKTIPAVLRSEGAA